MVRQPIRRKSLTRYCIKNIRTEIIATKYKHLKTAKSQHHKTTQQKTQTQKRTDTKNLVSIMNKMNGGKQTQQANSRRCPA